MWSSSETRTVDLLFSGFGHGVSIGSICFRVTHAAAFLSDSVCIKLYREPDSSTAMILRARG